MEEREICDTLHRSSSDIQEGAVIHKLPISKLDQGMISPGPMPCGLAWGRMRKVAPGAAGRDRSEHESALDVDVRATSDIARDAASTSRRESAGCSIVTLVENIPHPPAAPRLDSSWASG
jgi:hypothetical protein